MELPQEEQLDIGCFSRLFADTSTSYKFFWLLAILHQVKEGKQRIEYKTLVDDMIATAWYMVTEYHLSLGYNDGIERFVINTQKQCAVKNSENAVTLFEIMEDNIAIELVKVRKDLTTNVPYWIQTPFLKSGGRKATDKYREVIQIANEARESDFLYRYENQSKHNNTVILNDIWYAYLRHNQIIVEEWVKYKLCQYLQKRNPGIPGILNKLEPYKVRDLKIVREYWKKVCKCLEVQDIYLGKAIREENLTIYGTMAIDHVIPFQYTAHDELWDLTPTFSRVNSSKNNLLPSKQEIERLIEQQYKILQITKEKEQLKEAWEKCLTENVNNQDIRVLLYENALGYEEFHGRYCEVIQPVYAAAQKSGFQMWNGYPL